MKQLDNECRSQYRRQINFPVTTASSKSNTQILCYREVLKVLKQFKYLETYFLVRYGSFRTDENET